MASPREARTYYGVVRFEVDAPSREQAQESFNRFLDYADELGVRFAGRIMLREPLGDDEPEDDDRA